ncbi:NAD-dependent epimerase/dehydratase family protein [Clostridia bacterium]|nr:NAD-dependent epimerase/dehydratase family protein [Clostridia bacterium]
MDKKILITGGSGFMGINLIRVLRKKGYTDIRVIDIADFDYPEKDFVDFIKGDIRDKAKVKEAMANVNFVVHCAAALPLYSKQEIFTTEVDGTRNLLEEALAQKVERFVHTSTTAVYGIPDHHPLYESDEKYGVGNYGEAKVKAENLAVSYREKGLIVPVVRPKSFVGPERLGVFAMFYEWAKDAKNFPILGNGKNKYQFMDVRDLAEAVYLMLTQEAKLANDTFNAGAKEFTTMKEDYQAVLDAAGFGKKIIPIPATPAIILLRILEVLKLSPLYKWIYETAAKDSFVSIEKLQNQLGWQPNYSNKQALLDNYKWYLENYQDYENKQGVSHRVPWKQGALKIAKWFF